MKFNGFIGKAYEFLSQQTDLLDLYPFDLRIHLSDFQATCTLKSFSEARALFITPKLTAGTSLVAK
ncbi:hypothetical protein [Desulfosarcina sp. BuS5]|uniref:hypothetical protein n=1 Tax=Desulfosarcina sp. BuS5 TaxID=933262 RepID=UPI000487D570|nr:hypothetical protein [Desulfosarcina sp. BuS5]